ncbi:MAG: hypothetical protein MJ244_04075 [Clostridia bacterium]|nr:hypothetical protein [Clostridia bacterium]
MTTKRKSKVTKNLLTAYKKNKRAKKFNAKEYLKKNVINKDGKAVIPIHLKTKDEMYNKHDPRGITLSSDIRDYIDEVAYDIPYEYEITYEIQCDEKLTDEDKENMEKVVKTYYGLEIAGVEFDIKICKNRSNLLFAVSIISIILSAISFKYFDGLFLELILIALWFAIWEGIDVIFYDKGDLDYDLADAEQLYRGTVTFKE